MYMYVYTYTWMYTDYCGSSRRVKYVIETLGKTLIQIGLLSFAFPFKVVKKWHL